MLPTCVLLPIAAAKQRLYSITSSASASSLSGIAMPSALALFTLTTNSYFVGFSTVGRARALEKPADILTRKAILLDLTYSP